MIVDKSNDQISFRVPDELKNKFKTLLEAEGKNESAVLRAFVEQYVADRELFVDAIAGMFGYTKTVFKEKRRTTPHNSDRQDGDD